MKKSAIFLLHIGFWVIMSLIVFFLVEMATTLVSFLAPKVPTYNPFMEFKLYKATITGVGIMAIPFYLSYFLVPFFIKRPKWTILPATLH